MQNRKCQKAVTRALYAPETLLNLLHPNIHKCVPSPSSKGQDGVNVTPPQNMFDCVHVKDSLDSNAAADDNESSDEARQIIFAALSINVSVHYDSAVGMQEVSIAAAFLSFDTHRVRTAVQVLWREHRDRKMELVPVSVATNTAIDFCRKLQQDIDESFPALNRAHESSCGYCCSLQDTTGEASGCVPFARPCTVGPHKCLSDFVKIAEDHNPSALLVVDCKIVAHYSPGKLSAPPKHLVKKVVDDRAFVMGMLLERNTLAR